MSSLLPLFVSLQNGSQSIGGGGAAVGTLSSVNADQARSSGEALTPAFSQVLREYHETSEDFAPSTTDSPLGLPGTIVASFDGVQAPVRTFENSVPLTTDSPLGLPGAIVASFDSPQTPVRTLFQGRGFQRTGGDSTPGPVRQEFEISGKNLGLAQIPLPKALESEFVSQQVSLPKAAESGSVIQQVSLPKVAEFGVVSQPVPQGPEGKPASFVLNQEETLPVRPIIPSAKEIPNGLQQVGRAVLQNQALENPIVPKASSPLVRPQNAQPNPISPVTAIQAEGPAGFSGPNFTNQIFGKSNPGASSLLSDVTGASIEHRTTVPVDLLGESGLLGKGDRTSTIVETALKSVGLDPSGGQGLGNGMNHPQNSQSGFQQPSFSPGQGVGLRGLEERGPEFPAPALQRLQMDVQISENQRVSIDVGVQNRQVYAGLVTDQAVLRNLATQFVPQLENQLAEVDMELQEFSAEVREEREQDDHTLLNDSKYHKSQEPEQGSHETSSSSQQFQNRHGDHGLHLVA